MWGYLWGCEDVIPVLPCEEFDILANSLLPARESVCGSRSGLSDCMPEDNKCSVISFHFKSTHITTVLQHIIEMFIHTKFIKLWEKVVNKLFSPLSPSISVWLRWVRYTSLESIADCPPGAEAELPIGSRLTTLEHPPRLFFDGEDFTVDRDAWWWHHEKRNVI